jgi:hypothetical protein
MGWEGEGPLLLRRYDVQLFVWYALPHKFVASLEQKLEVAVALARMLECLGGRAARYAEVCRSPETDDLLRAWDAEDPAAPQRLRELLDRSGIEPPDTDLLAWGQVVGFEEARVRERVATALEEAIEGGRLSPGSAGFRRRQAEVANAALQEPWDGSDARSRLDAVQAERLERWLERGSAERRAIIERVADIVAAVAPRIEPSVAGAALEPALWLLERAHHGIALTQTGALNRALVREAAERCPDWWDADLCGPPNREDEVAVCASQARMIPEPPSRIGRQECERLAMKWGDRAEVAFVEAEDARGAVPGGEGDEGAVGETEIEVGVARVQVDDRRVIGTLEVSDREATGRQVGEERSSRCRAEPPSKEVVDLGGRRCRDHERPRLGGEGVEDRLALWLGWVCERDERRGVDEQRHVPKPSSRSCSGICEIGRRSSSSRRNPAASAKFRSRDACGW